MIGLVGKKVGMTRIFTQRRRFYPSNRNRS